MKADQAVIALAALAQETRLALFRLLVQQGTEGLSAGEIADRLRVPNATLSFHLKELLRAGLITSKQQGRFVFYAPNFTGMDQLIGFLTENCCQGTNACAPARGRAGSRKSIC